MIYHGNVRVGISPRGDKLLLKAHRLGLRSEEFYLGLVEPHIAEPDEIERSFFEFEDIEPVS